MADRKRGYAFTLKGDGMDFSREVDEPTARSLLNLALGGGVPASLAAAKGGSGSPGASTQAPTSLREFLNNHHAKRIPEKIVTIGEYLTSNGAADFSKDDVLTQFRVARELMPGNFRRDIIWTIANGWIAEDVKNSGRFYVTQAGKRAVEEKFSKEIKKKSGFRSVRRNRRRSA
jgi:hypothetical protein